MELMSVASKLRAPPDVPHEHLDMEYYKSLLEVRADLSPRLRDINGDVHGPRGIRAPEA